jgi:uncharacterized UBP type Zn finger protein
VGSRDCWRAVAAFSHFHTAMWSNCFLRFCWAVQGFPAVRATRALYHSGGSSLEAAVGWLEEHQGDADLDEPLMVPKVGSPHGV